MIRRLKNKFIAISMLSITIVLSVIIVAINLINYVNVRHNIDSRMSMIESGNGQMHKDLPMRDQRDDFGGERPFKGLNAEAPFDTRYFSVELNEDLSVASVNTRNINAVTEDEAASYATLLAEDNKTEGFYESYRYKLTTSANGNSVYIFLDCERELNTFYRFLIISIVISITGILLVLLLVVILSGRMIKPIAESYEKQKRFITDASHEIKTPLTIIEANTEILEMEAGESEWTASTRKQIERLTSLTEKLVFLSRMDEENQSYLQMLDFDLSEAVLDTVDPYTALATTKGKHIETNITAGIRYEGDETSLRQALSLLLDNAMKYSNESGDIKVSLSNSGKRVTLTVSNTVDEIEPGRHDEFFDRFYRREASRNSKTGGFGIGLSTVYAIVQAHKGKITAKSEDGHSLTIQMIL